MKIYKNEDLYEYSTMKIVGKMAEKLVVFEEIPEFTSYVLTQKYEKNILILGGGSNTVFINNQKEIWKLDFKGMEVSGDVVSVEAGVDWDSFVLKYIEFGGVGMEVLSKIPGTVGASPVQNIGAYGKEVSEFIKSVFVYDFLEHSFKEIENRDCGFSYRDSIFKKEKDRYVIFKIDFNILRGDVQVPNYPELRKYFEDKSFDVLEIRRKVMEIRERKLPDLNTIYNCGSFFKNLIVDKSVSESVLKKISNLRTFEVGDGSVKIPTAAILEFLGYKGFNFSFENGNFGFHKEHALVLISNGKGNSEEFLEFVESVKAKVKNEFDIELEVEVNML